MYKLASVGAYTSSSRRDDARVSRGVVSCCCVLNEVCLYLLIWAAALVNKLSFSFPSTLFGERNSLASGFWEQPLTKTIALLGRSYFKTPTGFEKEKRGQGRGEF